jgi:hypothetical protein
MSQFLLEPPVRQAKMRGTATTRPEKHMSQKGQAGRPALPPEQKKKRVTVSLVPADNAEWGRFARRARVSKGGLVAWLLGAPEAEACRRKALEHAHFYVPR